jgi:hypothetical protein
MIMFSNGNSFNGNSSYSGGERRNTEPFYWRFLCQVQPGAVS